MDALLLAGLLAAGIRLAMSIAIAALGEMVSQRSVSSTSASKASCWWGHFWLLTSRYQSMLA